MTSNINGQEKSLWQKFIEGEPIDTSKLKPEVLDSWQRCKGKVNPRKGKNYDIWSAKDVERIKLKYRELIEIAVPAMDNFYNFVKGSGFSITLEAVENNDHFVLEAIGDPSALAMHETSRAVQGSNWSEAVMGTSASAIAVYHDRPFQVHPDEHWCVCLKHCTTSSAPIHDPDTQAIIGTLTVAASYIKVQSHTLGMVVAAVDSIEKQLAVHRLAKKSEIANHFKTVVMECFSDGLIAIDEFNSVIHVNQKALDILGFKQNPIGQNIFGVLNRNFGMINRYRDLAGVINSQESVMDRFVNIQNSGGIIRCVVSTRFLESNGELLGKVLIIQQMSRAAKFVTSALGNYARFTFSDLIGQEQKFLDCIKIGIKVAKTYSNVLVLGESGTGKELFAQAIHNASSRKDQPFFAINCAAIPRDLLGSELFGYVEGAFTGAKKGGSPGKFELADGGTIFLDEIGEMPLDMQTSLLRVLEEKAVSRVGDKGAIPVDVRVIVATNRDLEKEVEIGEFRADLYYRINVVSIELPPLRDRKGDISLLIAHFVKKMAERMETKIDSIAPDVYRNCALYDWPGNVRELQNIIERAVTMVEGNTISSQLFPERLAKLSIDFPHNS
ncbi:MAG TPA: sigma-54-dependent Fis family transcriptional regulator, partial [Desulfosporosinus sp.]|nr:sigma-54-dependent Fis family transcriptional regulator [Desulfosporosinus sp.]